MKTRHYKYQPFEQDASGNVTLLHKLTTFPYAPVGISDSGEIAISAYYHNALVKNAKFKLYQPPKGATLFQIFFMNGAGVFGGNYYTNSEPGVGYTTTGGPLTVYTQPGWSNVVAMGAGGLGEVVGSYTDTTDTWHGFIYQNGMYTTIDYPGSKGTLIEGIGSNGSIIGYYTDTPQNNGLRPNLPFIALCAGGGVCTQSASRGASAVRGLLQSHVEADFFKFYAVWRV